MSGQNKTVYRIGELAALVGVTPDALRFYEREGILDPPERTTGGFRLYRRSAIDRLTFVRRAQSVGLTIRHIRQLLSPEMCRERRSRLAQELLSAKLDETTGQIRELHERRDLLRVAIHNSDEWLCLPS